MLLCVPGWCASGFLGALEFHRGHREHRSASHAHGTQVVAPDGHGDSCEDDRCCQSGVTGVETIAKVAAIGDAAGTLFVAAPSIDEVTRPGGGAPRGPPAALPTPIRC